ncbi:hypothetical protein C9374_000363 [Naegleria lovaniensis]|uniref:Uncharacterized protein n=1 Tax=Naegleria lovaniensis TaxID=51637 RepID=A0AA88H0A7_NAELO|nr:uncharacterized protein C9374_000363 [Naegleria lovaniensis]KAG2388924.1 hypothetical protein C9374_000363 [Naegleria lovaniensis]
MLLHSSSTPTTVINNSTNSNLYHQHHPTSHFVMMNNSPSHHNHEAPSSHCSSSFPSLNNNEIASMMMYDGTSHHLQENSSSMNHPVPDNQSTSSNHSHTEASSPPPSHPCFLSSREQDWNTTVQHVTTIQPTQPRMFVSSELIEPNTPCETPCTIWLSSFSSLSQLSLNSTQNHASPAQEAFEAEFNRKCNPYKSVNNLSRNLTPCSAAAGSSSSQQQVQPPPHPTVVVGTSASMKPASPSLSLDPSTARIVANVLSSALSKRSELQQKKIMKQHHSKRAGEHLSKLVIPSCAAHHNNVTINTPNNRESMPATTTVPGVATLLIKSTKKRK